MFTMFTEGIINKREVESLDYYTTRGVAPLVVRRENAAVIHDA